MKRKTKRSVSQKEKDKILKTISTLLEHYQEINTVYLIGSFLSSESFADIDLGLLLNYTPENLFEYEFEIEIKLQRRVHIAIDVRVLNNAPVSFVQNVVRHGKVILDLEPNIRADFESYSLRKYFDFVSFRRRYLSEVIDAPI